MSKYLPQARCWKCNYPQHQNFQLNSLEMKETRPPKPGDIAICGACGAFSIYGPQWEMLKPPSEVMEVIENTPEIMKMRDDLMRRDGM